MRGALGWLSAADLSVYDTLVLLNNVICSEEPAALAGRFQRNEEMRERLTRQDGQLMLERLLIITCATEAPFLYASWMLERRSIVSITGRCLISFYAGE